MMLKRIFAIFKARNLEFLSDRGSLSWNIILPVALMFGLSFIFSSDRAEYTVGVLQTGQTTEASAHPFLESRYIEFVPVTDRDSGFRRVARHQLDLLVEFGPSPRYWINPEPGARLQEPADNLSARDLISAHPTFPLHIPEHTEIFSAGMPAS